MRRATARVTYSVVERTWHERPRQRMLDAVRLTYLVVMIVLGVTLPALGDARPAAPCKGCTLDAPRALDPAHPVPLLVVLHGDRDHAPTTAARWRAATQRRGWVLLSLECPRAEGCKGSWWQWGGDPAWVRARVAAVQTALPIDPARIYLAGWSGGATYIGLNAPAWTELFAAVVFHGGGHSPGGDCPARPLPAYFLVGDANPLHQLVKDLHRWFDGCKQDVAWELISRGDHDKEERALTRARALAILDWLLAHARA